MFLIRTWREQPSVLYESFYRLQRNLPFTISWRFCSSCSIRQEW
jgi:hypothetical protein